MYMKFRVMGSVTLGAVVAATGLTVHAPRSLANDEAVDLDDLVVTATRTKKPVSAIPGTVTIIEEEELADQRLNAESVPGVLEHTVPGFGPDLQKLTGRAETLRGRNPLYLIDGVPQHNPLRDGSRDGHTIDPEFIERVEVIHGSNAIQGIGATGGIVNLVTKSIGKEGEWESEAALKLTTDDGFSGDGLSSKITFLSGIESGPWDFTGGLSFHDRGMFYDGDDNFVGLYPTQGDIMDSEQYDIYLKLGHEPSDTQRYQVMLNRFDLERKHEFRSVDGDPTNGVPTTSEAGAPVDVGDPAKNDVTTLTLNYDNTDFAGGKLFTQAYYQDFSALFEGGEFGGFFRLTPAGDPFLDQSEVQSEKFGLKIAQTWDNAGGVAGLSPSIGADYQRDASAQVLARSDREWVPETVLEGVSVFAQADYTPNDRLQLTGGVRAENASLKVDDFVTIAAANSTPVSGGSPDYSETLVNAGVLYDLTPTFGAFAAFSEGFTMPDVGRVLRAVNVPGQDVDTLINLEPVIAENVEVGVEYRPANGVVSLTWFQSDSDFGSRLNLNANNIFDVVREKTRIDGIQLSGEYFVSDNSSIGFNYYKSDGRVDTDNDGSLDTDLDGLNIAPDRLNVFGLFEFRNNARLRVQVSHLEDRDFEVLGGTGFSFEGFTTADVSYAMNTRYGDLSLGVDNLFDKQYITYFSQAQATQRADSYFAGRGRTLSVRLAKRF
ncbi:MAG: TonB-dependent receptor [Pseudomonadota bacterium]